jgi:hypothetical protein
VELQGRPGYAAAGVQREMGGGFGEGGRQWGSLQSHGHGSLRGKLSFQKCQRTRPSWEHSAIAMVRFVIDEAASDDTQDTL